MIKISVIVAAHNAEGSIGRAVRSALDQTERALEVIVVDDVSTDDTVGRVLAHCRHDARVRLIRAATNRGPGFARNLGIAAAQGVWVAILDADDTLLPPRLETLIRFAETHAADMVSDNLLVVDEHDGAEGPPMFPAEWFGAGQRRLDAETFILGNIGRRGQPRLAYGFMKPVIRREFLIANDLCYRISRFAEDYFFALECLSAGANWFITIEALYRYTVRAGSLTSKRDPADFRALIAAENDLLSKRHGSAHRLPRSALIQHVRSVEKALVWTEFAEALKRRNFAGAVTILAGKPKMFAHVFLESAMLAKRRLRLRFH